MPLASCLALATHGVALAWLADYLARGSARRRI